MKDDELLKTEICKKVKMVSEIKEKGKTLEATRISEVNISIDKSRSTDTNVHFNGTAMITVKKENGTIEELYGVEGDAEIVELIDVLVKDVSVRKINNLG